MSVEFYRVLHWIGVVLLTFSLGGVAMHVINGGTRDHRSRRLVAITHGVALALILVAGFGMLAKLGIAMASGWVITKLIIWFLLGGVLFLLYRVRNMAVLLWFAIPTLIVAAYLLANFKPF